MLGIKGNFISVGRIFVREQILTVCESLYQKGMVRVLPVPSENWNRSPDSNTALNGTRFRMAIVNSYLTSDRVIVIFGHCLTKKSEKVGKETSYSQNIHPQNDHIY